MRKFTNPISMLMTGRDIIEGDLIFRLSELGYNVSFLGNAVNPDAEVLLYTNTRHNDVKYLMGSCIERDVIPFTNTDLFIAIAAMSEGDEFFRGEVLVETDFLEDFAVFINYQFPDQWGKYRKATREELIEYYSRNKEVNNVSHPEHYGGKDNPYEAIKVIEAWGLGFCLGNTVKYLARAGKKDPAKELEDLKKAAWYLDREITSRSSPTPNT